MVDLRKIGPNQDTVMILLLKSLKDVTTITEDKGKLTNVTVITANEDITYALCNQIVKETVYFFSRTAVGTDIRTRDNVVDRIDSIKIELYQNENQYSQLKDNSFQTVKTKGLLELLRAERRIKILNEMFIEATKQYEILSFKISNSSTGIQIVDTPRYPLEFKKQSTLVRIIIFGFLGFVIGSMILIGFVLFKRMMSNLKNID